MLTLLLREHFRDRNCSSSLAHAPLEVDETQDVGFLALESLDPRLDGFAVPDWSALQPLKWLREMIVAGPPVGHGLFGNLCNSSDFSDSKVLLGHDASKQKAAFLILESGFSLLQKAAFVLG